MRHAAITTSLDVNEERCVSRWAAPQRLSTGKLTSSLRPLPRTRRSVSRAPLVHVRGEIDRLDL